MVAFAPPSPQVPILEQIKEAVQANESHLKAGDVVKKGNYKKYVVHQEIDTSSEKVPEAPELGEVTVGQLMPQCEPAGRHVDVKANSAQRQNCVEFLLVNKVSVNGKVVVRIPNPEVFREVVGRANADLVGENTDWCLVLEYAEPDDHGLGKLALNMQDSRGADRFRAYHFNLAQL